MNGMEEEPMATGRHHWAVEAAAGRWETRLNRWLLDVDVHLLRRAGVDHRDLADMPWAGWFDDGVRPATAARRALAREGFDG